MTDAPHQPPSRGEAVVAELLGFALDPDALDGIVAALKFLAHKNTRRSKRLPFRGTRASLRRTDADRYRQAATTLAEVLALQRAYDDPANDNPEDRERLGAAKAEMRATPELEELRGFLAELLSTGDDEGASLRDILGGDGS